MTDYQLNQYAPGVADASALAIVMHESIHALGGASYTQEQLKAWSPAPRSGQIAKDRFTGLTVFAAEDDQGIAAFMAMNDAGYIDFAYAHPRAAGQGAASMTYAALENYARHIKHPTLTSDVSLIARPFFEKRGFIVLRQQYPVCNGVALSNFHVEKHLT